jgi:uroporphyrinogen III methyltransferase/synthase
MRALECLAQADLVLHDKLVPPRLLDFAGAGAEQVCVADLFGCHAERGPQVQEALIQAARQGKCVVRLKGGDPLLFGRGGEEAEALREAGIDFEIVPGVTAALAAAASAGIPLTHRFHASAVALVTGHEDLSKPENLLDWPALARFPGTLVLYMGMKRLPQIVQSLLEAGKAPATPAAAVHWAGTAEQRTIEAALAELPDCVRTSGLGAPAIVIVGSVVGLRDQLCWFEKRPLFGKRIVVTRPRNQADELARQLEARGAAVHLLPVVSIQEPSDWGPADRALRNLKTYDWLVFTSANGVHALVRRLRQLGFDLRSLGTLRLGAIGPATAAALRGYHLEPDVVPDEYRSEALAQALKERATGQRILLARADRGREVLRTELAGVASVEQVAVYAQTDTADPDASVLRLLREETVDYVTLTSSNIARAFFRAVDGETLDRIRKGAITLASISPVTSATIREWNLPVAVEARSYTASGLVAALVESVKGKC